MKQNFILLLVACTMVGCCSSEHSSVPPGELNFAQRMQLAPAAAKFAHDSLYIWGASPIKGDDGKYHLFYSQWGRQFGFMAWVTHSEIAHAVADHPMGPYQFSDQSLPPREGNYWDATTTHNPHIHRFDGKYYLYYTGNRGDMVNVRDGLNWTHRNNQRIGVAYADSPYGPWTRLDYPIIDVTPDSTAHDSQCVGNPSVTRMPDGRFLMVYKAVASRKPQPFGGPVVHLTAISETPIGPFIKQNKPIFTIEGADFPAEDPYVWYQDNCYYAIVKDFKGHFTHAGQSLALFWSSDGLDWKPAKNPLVSRLERKMEDGSTERYLHLERPQLLHEEGNPTVLFLAVDHDKELTESFNIQIPLQK